MVENGVFYNWFCLCLDCHYKWIGTFDTSVSLFKLECGACGSV